MVAMYTDSLHEAHAQIMLWVWINWEGQQAHKWWLVTYLLISLDESQR